MTKAKEELREARKQWFAPMEQKLKEMHTKEDDSLFYYHSSEDRIVLSHAMFWTMTFSKILRPLYPERGSTSPCIPSPQAREKLKIAETDDLQSFGIALEPLPLRDSR